MAETIFDVLRDDHDTQRTLLDLIEQTHGDSEGRRELFARLRAEALAHAAAEERIFYAALMADERTREKARHSVVEHQEAEAILDELEEMDMSSPGWIQRFRTVAEDLRHHVDEEEHEVFQQAGRVLTEQQKRSMAAEFRAEKADDRDRLAS
ncbi:MAG: hemerythrin domain-containing protein [Myxococcales bacterium]|nr:hemerythrin domain-containing protein [Myxococcales bacterium]